MATGQPYIVTDKSQNSTQNKNALGMAAIGGAILLALRFIK